jgi:hypothetical protein
MSLQYETDIRLLKIYEARERLRYETDIRLLNQYAVQQRTRETALRVAKYRKGLQAKTDSRVAKYRYEKWLEEDWV